MQQLKHSFLARFLALALGVGIISNLINPLIPNGFEAIIIVIIIAIIAYYSKSITTWLDNLTGKQVKTIIWGALVLMVIGQLLILNFMPVTVYHDPYRVLSQADQISHGNASWNSSYFWRYPNNVSITYLMSVWLKATQFIGLSTNTSIHILSLLTLDTFIVLMLKTLDQFSQHNRHIVFGGLAFMLLTPFAYTYFLQVFYSDLPSLLILLIIFRIFYFWSSDTSLQKWLQGILLVIMIMLGQLLKPNIIVLVPALIMLAILLLKQHSFKKAHLVLPILLVCLGFALSVPAKQAIFSQTNYSQDNAFELPATSWIAMGLNDKTRGTYSGTDIGHEVNMATKQERQSYTTKLIAQRARQLGPVGLITQWTIKLGILLNASNPQDFYNGGQMAAPHWFQKNANFYNVFTSLLYQIGTIFLFATLILRLWHWRPNLSNRHEMIGMLSVITTLGYMGFHSLVWETEPRYGQIMLPLILISIATIPAAKTHAQLVTKRLKFAPLATLLSFLIGALTLSQLFPTAQIVAAQRSQLSSQYGAKGLALKPKGTLTQMIPFNKDAQRISILVDQATTLDVTLENVQSKKVYRLHKDNDDYIYNGHMPAGQYRLKATNKQHKSQYIQIVSTYAYKLAPEPLKINHTVKPTASFVYTVTD